jgi:hypothetical protein
MNIHDLMNIPARESGLFWGFILLILAVILMFSLREFFIWYFKINELREEIAKISKRIESLGQQSAAVKPAADIPLHTVNDAEIAAIIATVKNMTK